MDTLAFRQPTHRQACKVQWAARRDIGFDRTEAAWRAHLKRDDLFLARIKPVEDLKSQSLITMPNLSTRKTREALLEDVDKLKRNATQVAQDVRDHATAHVDETKQRVTDTILTVRENLTTHPLGLIGLGFALGFLLGFRFRR